MGGSELTLSVYTGNPGGRLKFVHQDQQEGDQLEPADQIIVIPVVEVRVCSVGCGQGQT